jgi:hypothetical protein
MIGGAIHLPETIYYPIVGFVLISRHFRWQGWRFSEAGDS